MWRGLLWTAIGCANNSASQLLNLGAMSLFRCALSSLHRWRQVHEYGQFQCVALVLDSADVEADHSRGLEQLLSGLDLQVCGFGAGCRGRLLGAQPRTAACESEAGAGPSSEQLV